MKQNKEKINTPPALKNERIKVIKVDDKKSEVKVKVPSSSLNAVLLFNYYVNKSHEIRND